MKSLFVVASLAVLLVALPANAQLGPAGVPGAPGLAETDPSVKAAQPVQPPPSALEEQPRTSGTTACSTTKNADQCKKRQLAKKKMQQSCHGKTAKARRQCLNNKKMKTTDCSKAREPARCEQFRRTQTLCTNKQGSDEYRQCLRENLAP